MIFIDAHNYIKRIYHGGGNPYSLFYTLMTSHSATTVQVVCDSSKSRAYRKAIHPGYKAGRPTGDDPVYWEVYNNCQKLALEFPNTELINMTEGEADDYIMDKAGPSDTVISNDKDLWPLLDKDVNILLNASTKVDLELVQMKFQCKPRHIHLYKALVGDTSDKIPGKRGFGAKAWLKFTEPKMDLYTHHFSISHDSYDPDIMTEQAMMSWKLAIPYEGYKFETIFSKPNGQPLEFIEQRGIML